MKQISARTFRVAFPKLTEPVTVSTRGEAGEIRILGTGTPLGTWPTVLSGALDNAVRPFTPVPKPSRKG